MPESRRRLAAIMFTDMVGYSAMAQADEAAALAILDRHNRLLRPIFVEFRGREVKTVGDAFLVEFESALDAARCALRLQESLHGLNRSTPAGAGIQIRIGIHVGDVVETDGDVLGDAVNIASRIEPLAEPGGICMTQQVFDQVQNKLGVALIPLPPTVLKNIRLPVRAYRVVPPWSVAPTRALPRGEPGGRHHLAVLPLANISPDPNDGYFADGLTEELISQLSHLRNLSVIARTSVAPYKLSPKPIAEVGSELGVDTVLEGSVRKAGKRIRITLQLIDAVTQRHMWANSYDRDLDDVFAVQTDIAERTADALRLEFAQVARSDVVRKPTTDLAAYDQYLRGLVAAAHRSRTGLEEAVACFEKATKLDPDFGEAFAAWANLYVGAAGDSVALREVMPRARVLAARALELDPESSDAHAALANIVFQFDLDWKRAEAEFERAIALNPSNVQALRFLALLLFALDRYDEAKELVRRTIRLDPAGPDRNMLAWLMVASGEFDAALTMVAEEMASKPPSAGAHAVRGLFLLTAGRPEEALAEADTPVAGATDDERFDLALLNALVGRPEPARGILAEWERGELDTYVSGTHLAMLYSALGEKGRALDELEKDFREGDRVLWLWNRGVSFDAVRDDPRFVALLQQYGLPVRPVIRPRFGVG